MANKRTLQQLARLGLAGGVLVVGGLAINSNASTPIKKPQKNNQADAVVAYNASLAKKYVDPFANLEEEADGNMGYHLMTKDELKLQVNQDGWDLFNSLDAEGQKLALEVASARCNNTNKCYHLNACQTEKNACSGQGECKGKGKCAFADKSLAVKVVAKRMAEKRAEAAKKANGVQPESSIPKK